MNRLSSSGARARTGIAIPFLMVSLTVVATSLAGGCGSATSGGVGSGGAPGSGVGSGGASGWGGTASSGGVTGSGGGGGGGGGTKPAGSGGAPAPGSGGKLGSGGVAASGGAPATGGMPGAAGTSASGGARGTGGVPASGGAPGSGASAGAGGRYGSGGAGGAVAPGDGLIVAPDGVDSAPGTLAAPTTLTAALARVSAGQSILMRGGTYAYSVQLTIDRANDGTAAAPKNLLPYASEKPVLDFSSQPYGTDANPRGLQVNGSYWHVKGLEVKGSADNGIYVAGSNNVIEACVVHANRDTGLQLGRAASSDAMADWPANNLILNCESYDNYDAPPGAGENADGFAAKLTVGEGNVFRGCVSHNNIDDGWDLYTKQDTGPIGTVMIDQCVSFHNGTLTNGTMSSSGDRNGFKLGGDSIPVVHVVTRSIAFGNGKNGFTWNSNPGAIRLSNTLAFDNADGNYKFGDNSTSTAAVFTNNVSFWTATGSAQSDKTIGTDASSTNCWWDKSRSQPSVNAKGLVVTAADFASSLASPPATIPRATDGSLDLSFFRLAAGSDLVNAGAMPAGALPFDPATAYSGLPDLGAVETK